MHLNVITIDYIFVYIELRLMIIDLMIILFLKVVSAIYRVSQECTLSLTQ